MAVSPVKVLFVELHGR